MSEKFVLDIETIDLGGVHPMFKEYMNKLRDAETLLAIKKVAGGIKVDTDAEVESEVGFTTWHENDDDVEPLPGDVKVEYRMTDGSVDEDLVGDINWSSSPGEFSVVAYRVLEDSTSDPGWTPWDPAAMLDRPNVLGLVRVKTHEGNVSQPRAVRDFRWRMDGDKVQNDDIISYQRVGKPGIKLPHDGEEVKWKATARARPPLPDSTRISFATVAEVNAADEEDRPVNFAGTYDVEDLRWSSVGEDNRNDIARYKIHGAVPDDWHPHVPRYNGRRPKNLQLLDRVRVRTRKGNEANLRVNQVKWGILKGQRDYEVVAYKVAK